jgi:hypothetical protein
MKAPRHSGPDLVGRKLPMGTGRLARRFFHPVGAYLELDAWSG